MDVVLLARLQFAVTIMFHFLFPPITIGLALLIALVETARWRTGNALYERMSDFWLRIFGLNFAVGVASGIVMEFQFGTNWATYSRFVGDIFVAPHAAEGVLAFFLESGFLGLLLLGRKRISSGLRCFAAWMVSLGSTLSAFWILVANSWMQTPAGYAVEDGRARLTDFWAAVFNPSTVPRVAHTLASCWVMGAFLMAGVGAWYFLKGRGGDVARASMRLGTVAGLIATVLVFATGDRHARQVARTQPAKFAAMEGLYSTEPGAPLILFALPPTQQGRRPGPELVITNFTSMLAFGNFQAPVQGLREFPEQDWPPVAITFLSFHNMVILGNAMALIVLAGGVLLWRGRLEQVRWWQRAMVLAVPLPMIAIQLGWMTAEVGRQPWIVYGLLRTRDAVSKVVPASHVLFSIVLFSVIYALLGALWLYLLRKEIVHGPASASPAAAPPAAVAGTRLQEF
jgi:cytochrome d ubiquinol oxidase subunit I